MERSNNNSSLSITDEIDNDFANSSSENDSDNETGIAIDSNGIIAISDLNKITDYVILTETQVFEEMNQTANETSVIIRYSPSICRSLLHHFKWNKETLLERFYEALDPETMFREACLLKPSCGLLNTTTAKQCRICYENKHLTGLQCGHLFCKECWRGYLNCKILDEGRPFISCPEHKCNIIMDDENVEKLINNLDVQNAYKKLVLNSFVESNSLLKWCPGAGCGRIVKVPHAESQQIDCDCGCIFCFQCLEQWHEPISCTMLKRWLKKCSDDSETSNWLNANTKDCPKCHIIIEKDGGCNHMTCKNNSCKFEFCWMCLGPWEPHGSGWYSCNRYNEAKPTKTRDEQDKSRSALQRYLHYYNRYANHHNSLKLENKLYAQVNDKMDKMQQQNFSWIETQFLKKAVDVLSECRRTLMYTYAFAYYLEQNNMTKIFEDNQQDLELATEQLSEFFERDLENENLITLKQEVQDKYRYVEQRRTALLKHCAEGNETNQWLFCKDVNSTQSINNQNNSVSLNTNQNSVVQNSSGFGISRRGK